MTDRSDPGGRVRRHHESGHGTTRIGYPIEVRHVSVVARTTVTPRMVRLTFGGPALDGFHTYQCDDHIKIVFPDADGTMRAPVANDHLTLDWPSPFPRTRDYTVRAYRPSERELDVDLVRHDGGLASTWADEVEIGAPAVIAGPPGSTVFSQQHAHYVFAIDSTALPAVARWLEEAPAHVTGHVVVDIDDPVEQTYPLTQREGVSVTWLDRTGGSRLAETVTSLSLPDDTFLFAGGEFDDIAPLRAWTQGRFDAIIKGYWKRGIAEFDDDD